MPLHKVPVHLWKQLLLREGLCSRLPSHYLRTLEEARTPTPVHYRPHGAKFKISPKNGQRERVEDVPIPIYHPPESQLGLWGGEGWILGHRYTNNDKVGDLGFAALVSLLGTRADRTGQDSLGNVLISRVIVWASTAPCETSWAL